MTIPLGNVVPTVLDPFGRGERYDVYSMLLRNRIIFVGRQIDDDIANVVVAQLLLLAQEDPTKDIQLFVNSPGGSIDAGLAIYDAMHLVEPDVATTCVGLAASMGAVIMAGGARGKRFALPNSRLLIHQATSGVQGSASDIDIQAREILRLQARIKELLASDTGQPVERIAHDMNRDFWMSATEAKEYGLVDAVLGQTPATAAADRAENALKHLKRIAP